MECRVAVPVVSLEGVPVLDGQECRNYSPPMKPSQHFLFILCVALPAFWDCPANGEKISGVTRYVRFAHDDIVSYGILENDKIQEIKGDLFGKWEKTDKTHDLDEVKLLVPSRPTQVIAMAGNYKSHLDTEKGGITTIVTTITEITTDAKGGTTISKQETATETRVSGEVPEKFRFPQPFFKSPSCLLADGGNIVIPPDAGVVHFEAEMVIVIAKKARNISKEHALDFVLGVTCGNDISAREWQKNDVQWWRAKGSDTFGPCGPCITSGLDYDNLQMKLRLNGKMMQDENTSYLINDVRTMVSVISRHVTLNPGDLIFTGTPGTTSGIEPGDTVEVEIEGVGVLRNNVVAGK